MITIADGQTVSLVGDKKEVLDSTGMYWVTSWIDGGSLIEAPELVKHGGYYYLFFAAGRYCQDSYSEGVARSSTGVFGPYEKMQSPLLTTGLVGSASSGGKIIGPGHASFVADEKDPNKYFVLYAASVGENCNRMTFVEEMLFNNETGWPYVNFGGGADNGSTGDRALDAGTAGAESSMHLRNPTPPARRVVAPCRYLDSSIIQNWDIPHPANASLGFALDNSGAVCTT